MMYFLDVHLLYSCIEIKYYTNKLVQSVKCVLDAP